jgi:hypothetical protein
MQRFFFNCVGPNCSISDVAGQIMADDAAAREHARQLARELIKSQIDSSRAPSGWIDVEDERHRRIFMLPLRAMSD